MEYCGVKYLTTKAVAGPSWKWRILHNNKCGGALSGEAKDRLGAIAAAHEAIGLSLRATCDLNRGVRLPHLADQALHILHGARNLPSPQAIEALQPFIEAMRHRTSHNRQLGDASAIAIDQLIENLHQSRVASDDVWQSAIDSTLSFANEMSGSSEYPN